MESLPTSEPDITRPLNPTQLHTPPRYITGIMCGSLCAVHGVVPLRAMSKPSAA